MKVQIFTFLVFIPLIFCNCNSSKRSEEIATYTYIEEKIELNDTLKAKVPAWVQEGKICYGLVVQINKYKEPVKGKPVKAKIVQINENSVKMKALESVSLVEEEGCDQMGISKGQTWDEVEGDLYLTLEAALNALEKMSFYSADKNE